MLGFKRFRSISSLGRVSVTHLRSQSSSPSSSSASSHHHHHRRHSSSCIQMQMQTDRRDTHAHDIRIEIYAPRHTQLCWSPESIGTICSNNKIPVSPFILCWVVVWLVSVLWLLLRTENMNIIIWRRLLATSTAPAKRQTFRIWAAGLYAEQRTNLRKESQTEIPERHIRFGSNA